MAKNEAYIVAAARTPVAKRRGAFLHVRPDDMLAHVLREVLVRAPAGFANADAKEIGDVIVGTGGARKLRWARPFSGKSGGFRVIYYYHSSAIPLLILGLFAKNEKINLSKTEMNELEKILSNYAKHYLTGVRRHVKGR